MMWGSNPSIIYFWADLDWINRVLKSLATFYYKTFFSGKAESSSFMDPKMIAKVMGLMEGVIKECKVP